MDFGPIERCRQNLAVVGSRSFTDYGKFKFLLADLIHKIGTVDLIISGGAIGTDSMARRFAEEFGIPIREHLPEWSKYGKSAGYIRNVAIINDADVVAIFWDRVSRGTGHSIRLAKKANKPFKIFHI